MNRWGDKTLADAAQAVVDDLREEAAAEDKGATLQDPAWLRTLAQRLADALERALERAR